MKMSAGGVGARIRDQTYRPSVIVGTRPEVRSERSERKARREPDSARAEMAPALIFDPAQSAFVWANGAGLALFGVKSIARLTQDRLDRALPAAARLIAFAAEAEGGARAMPLDFWTPRGLVHVEAVVERLALSRDKTGVLIRSGDVEMRRETVDRPREPAAETDVAGPDLSLVPTAPRPPLQLTLAAPALVAECRTSAELSREDEETLREIARLIREGELTELPDRRPVIGAAQSDAADEPAGSEGAASATPTQISNSPAPDAAGELAFDGEPMRLLSEISHELRTPLTAIRGYAELISARPEDARVGDRARHIVEAADHVLALIGDILDARQIATGQANLVFTDVDLALEIEQAAAMIAPQALKAGVTLLAMPAPGLPKVVADARRVRQVLINIAANAVKFTAPGGTVRIGAAYAADGGVEVSVSDTGRGMAPAEMTAALGVPAAAPRRAGRGIGLPLSRALAAANGARLSIDSRPGIGTLVSLSFPVSSVVPP